jgi:hypothetical protein
MSLPRIENLLGYDLLKESFTDIQIELAKNHDENFLLEACEDIEIAMIRRNRAGAHYNLRENQSDLMDSLNNYKAAFYYKKKFLKDA